MFERLNVRIFECLNVRNFESHSTGEDTRTLVFFLEVEVGDPIVRLNFQNRPGKDTALICGRGYVFMYIHT
jgi:hypothetical protein